MSRAARGRSSAVNARPISREPPRNLTTGLNEQDKKKAAKFIASNWNGEDPSIRVSPRVERLDEILFPGASLIDDCARSSLQKFLVLGLRMRGDRTFDAFINCMRDSKVVPMEYVEAWKDFIDPEDSRNKSSKHYFDANFYEKRTEEHLRLKLSLMHPSSHYTLDALENSWRGVRSKMGHFGSITDLMYDPDSKTGSIFGIKQAL